MTKLNILSAGAVKKGVAELAEAFAREQGDKVEIRYATAPELRERITGGEAPDVVVAPPAVIDELVKAGKVIADTRAFLGRSRIGVVVHAESAVKDVPDVEHGPGAVGLTQISEIRVLIAKGAPVRLAGPLPDTVQNFTSYEAAAFAGGSASAKAAALARYMATPAAKKVFAATGID